MKTQKYQGSIKKWLVTIIVVVATLTSLLGISFFSYWFIQNRYNQTLKLAHTVSHVIGQNVAKIVLLNDVSAAADVTTSLESFTTLESMVLYKLDKTPIYQYSKENKTFDIRKLSQNLPQKIIIENGYAKLFIDAFYQKTKLGYVFLVIKIQTIFEIFEQNLYKLFMIFGIIFLISIFLANYFAKKFINPIITLVLFLEKLELSNIYKKRVKVEGDNEYTHLYDEVNSMLDRIEAAQKSLRLAAVTFQTQSGMIITNVKHEILDVNNSFVEITGYTKEEAVGNTPAFFKSGVHDIVFYENMYQSLQNYGYWSGEIYNKRKDGTIFPEYLTIQSVLDEQKNILYYVASFVDLTLQKKTEERLHYLERYDALTGLANKQLLLETMQKSLNQKKHCGSLILVDIVDFKVINEAFDYATGDLVLQELARRLQNIENQKSLARVGHDQFALWFDFSSKTQDDVFEKTKFIAQYIESLVTKPYFIDDLILNINVVIGIDLYTMEQRDATVIFQQAEIALHSGKKMDLKVSFFDYKYQENLQHHITIYSELVEAIKSDQFELYYQPQYNAKHKIYSVEALIRWNHPTKGLIPPDSFIPIAEQTGLIVDIGNIVIDKACKQLALWAKQNNTQEIYIAINVSSKQFIRDDFIDIMQNAIQKHNINPRYLKVELTESIVVADIENVITKMNSLKELGILISLDDFGTGYSSLQYLRDLPLNQVKIDQSFVKNMLHNQSDEAIIRSVLLICNTLGIDVIAEGVEHKEDVEFLEKLGCHNFQGYYFSKPKPVNALVF